MPVPFVKKPLRDPENWPSAWIVEKTGGVEAVIGAVVDVFWIDVYM